MLHIRVRALLLGLNFALSKRLISVQNYVRKGEWLELRSPGTAMDASGWSEWLARDKHFPGPLLQKLIRQGGLQADGARLRLRIFPDEESGIRPEWTDLNLLYEDDFCLVVYKPAGMPVHPAEEGQEGTLAHAVASYYETTGQACRIRHIHRLDTDTTGPVLYAKNEFAHIVLDADMRRKAISRIYTAIVQGHLNPAFGIIDRPIGKDRHNPKRRRVSPGGDNAVTRYTTLEQAPFASRVELELETGRTHQIRVHMQHLGSPLVGDTLYGGPSGLFTRQALHGCRLDFTHPWTGEAIRVDAEPPSEMDILWRSLMEGNKP
jgi:23S rRNA pseudouridine1911/1915/1917 synthase